MCIYIIYIYIYIYRERERDVYIERERDRERERERYHVYTYVCIYIYIYMYTRISGSLRWVDLQHVHQGLADAQHGAQDGLASGRSRPIRAVRILLWGYH